MIIVSYFGLNSPGQDLLLWRTAGYCLDIIGSMNNYMVTDASRDMSLGYDFGTQINSRFDPFHANGYPPQWDSIDDQISIILGTQYVKQYNFNRMKNE